MRTNRSNFGADINQTTNTTPEVAKSTSTETKAPFRKEVGAIWSNKSKTTGQEFLKVQLTLPKEMVQEALVSSTGDTINFGLISFPNRSYEGNTARPTHRIFEDKK